MITLPEGYRVIDIKDDGDTIVIGMFDFMLTFKDAEETIEYNGSSWEVGMMACIPHKLAGHCCSCREYHKIKSEPFDYFKASCTVLGVKRCEVPNDSVYSLQIHRLKG
jgi:hypothetical protein